jgi:hypothetical protein
VVDLLLWQGVLCFEGRIRGNILRHVFGSHDFLRKQIKAKEKTKRR